jgi:protein TonB
MISEILKKKKKELQKKMSLRERKHQANTQSNYGLYFQIGLVATLFIIFGVFQLKIEKKETVFRPKLNIDAVELPTVIHDYIIEEEIVKELIKKAPLIQPTSYENPLIVDDDKPIIETFIKQTSTPVNDYPKVEDVNVSELPPEIDTFPVSLVSDYPEFPGCEKFNDKNAKFSCFQEKISKHLQRNFDSDLAADYGLTGIQKILISFTINHKGEVVDVTARAPHIELKNEAIRVINSLPIMKPAKQGFKKVNVTYGLPLIFKVN